MQFEYETPITRRNFKWIGIGLGVGALAIYAGLRQGGDWPAISEAIRSDAALRTELQADVNAVELKFGSMEYGGRAPAQYARFKASVVTASGGNTYAFDMRQHDGQWRVERFSRQAN